MPVGVQRINARQSAHPTPHIGFIKPLPGPGASAAEEFLSRVAAIVHPILAAHHLAVMTLEEHEPNAEFLGRNFNAGEVIQLVLRRRSTESRRQTAPREATSIPRHAIQTVATVAARTGPGAEANPIWLPFRSVVLVMLHELAHCVQMNHSRAFWAVRNAYAAEMRELWAKGYRGEGMWGRGRAVGSHLELDGPSTGLEDDMPAHLCGGVYRRRRRGTKRKRAAGEKEQLTYAERQQRRIKKKFGEGGTALGDDAQVRAQLESKKKGKKATAGTSKPRVAQSQRGRELRAQAALARLGQLGPKEEDSNIKHEEHQTQLPFTKTKPKIKAESEPTTASTASTATTVKQEDISTDDGNETESASDSGSEYSHGTLTNDSSSSDLVKVCPDSGATTRGGEAEGEEDAEHVKAERRELDDLYGIPLAAPSPSPPPLSPLPSSSSLPPAAPAAPAAPKHADDDDPVQPSNPQTNGNGTTSEAEIACPACSLANSLLQACCMACGCVLRPEKVPGHWRCRGPMCRDGTNAYVNSGDYGVCGVCGARRE